MSQLDTPTTRSRYLTDGHRLLRVVARLSSTGGLITEDCKTLQDVRFTAKQVRRLLPVKTQPDA